MAASIARPLTSEANACLILYSVRAIIGMVAQPQKGSRRMSSGFNPADWQSNRATSGFVLAGRVCWRQEGLDMVNNLKLKT